MTTISELRQAIIESANQYSTSDKDTRLYIKRFLLDTSVNLNQWGVNPDTIDTMIASFIGMPLVLTDNFDHPVLDDQSFEHNAAYQEQFAIGRIIDTPKYGTKYDAIIEITNKAAAEAIRAGNIPIFTSPAINVVGPQPDTDIQVWRGLHLAVVQEPAFGVKRTSVAGHCDGNKQTCLMMLRKASIDKGNLGCGFCPGAKLSELIIKKEAEKNTSHLNNPHITSDLEQASTNSTPVSPKKSEKKQLKQTAKAFSKVLETQKGEYETKIKALEAEIVTLKAAKTDFESKVAAIEKDKRKSDIAALLTAEIYPDKTVREALINEFASSTLTLDNIKLSVSGMTKTKVAKTEVKNTPVPYITEPEPEKSEQILLMPAGAII